MSALNLMKSVAALVVRPAQGDEGTAAVSVWEGCRCGRAADEHPFLVDVLVLRGRKHVADPFSRVPCGVVTA